MIGVRTAEEEGKCIIIWYYRRRGGDKRDDTNSSNVRFLSFMKGACEARARTERAKKEKKRTMDDTKKTTTRCKCS